ncbi:MAG: prepilin-type N-terminal cleavage/methylation domain-containing protein, partial [Gammaproteobacteria bacterium]
MRAQRGFTLIELLVTL